MKHLRAYLTLLVAGVAIAIGVTLFSPWASSSPDGLERVAEDQQFLDRQQGPSFHLIADYKFPGIENESVATVVAGVVGVLAVTGVALAAGSLLRRREDAPGESARGESGRGGGR